MNPFRKFRRDQAKRGVDPLLVPKCAISQPPIAARPLNNSLEPHWSRSQKVAGLILPPVVPGHLTVLKAIASPFYEQICIAARMAGKPAHEIATVIELQCAHKRTRQDEIAMIFIFAQSAESIARFEKSSPDVIREISAAFFQRFSDIQGGQILTAISQRVTAFAFENSTKGFLCLE